MRTSPARRRLRSTRGAGSEAGTGGRDTRRARGRRSWRSGWCEGFAAAEATTSRSRHGISVISFESPELLVQGRPMLGARGVRGRPILERLALGEDVRPSLGLAPRTHYDHEGQGNCTMDARQELLFCARLRDCTDARVVKMQDFLVNPSVQTRRTNA